MIKTIKIKPIRVKPMNLQPSYKPKYKPKKSLTYPEAKLRFNLKPFTDIDKDGVPNWRDCRPYDPNEQGLKEIKDAIVEKVGDIKDKTSEKISDIKEDRKIKKEYKKAIETGEGIITTEPEERTIPVYLIVLYNGEWYNWGAFDKKTINKAMRDAKSQPGVENVISSLNPNQHKIFNKEIIRKEKAEKSQQFRQHISSELEKRGLTREQMKSNIEEGLSIKPERRAAFKQELTSRLNRGGEGKPYSTNPKIGPKYPSGWWRIGDEPQRVQSTQPSNVNVYVGDRNQPRPMESEQQMPSQGLSREQQVILQQQQIINRLQQQNRMQQRNPSFSMSTTRPKGMMPMAQFKFVKPITVRMGRRLK